jgi:hypothetical protein
MFLLIDDILIINNLRICCKKLKKIIDENRIVIRFIINEVGFNSNVIFLPDKYKSKRKYYYDSYKLHQIMKPLIKNNGFVKVNERSIYTDKFEKDETLYVSLVDSQTVSVVRKGRLFGYDRKPIEVKFNKHTIYQAIIRESGRNIKLDTLCNSCKESKANDKFFISEYELYCMDCYQKEKYKRGYNKMGFGIYKDKSYIKVVYKYPSYCIKLLDKDYNKLKPVKKRFVDWLLNTELLSKSI